jgi:Ca2+-binding RTX toxin-like protein
MMGPSRARRKLTGTTHTRRRQQRALTAAIEPLPRRTMLSVALADGVLRIVGSDARDSVLVTADPHFINVADVTVNGATTQFAFSTIRTIDVRTLAGDDSVRVDDSLRLLEYPVFVDAGAGNDRVSTSSGRDTILGGEGNDKIWSGLADDRVDGQGGRDVIMAGDGNDTVTGGASNDRLRGQSGNDSLDGGKGNDRIDGNDGDDTLSDKAGRDRISGGAGNDIGTFKDAGRIKGGDGNDQFTSNGKATVYGEAGDDVLSGLSVLGGAANDVITGREVYGGDGNDRIVGTDKADQLYGDDGTDVITAGGSADYVAGGNGDDALYGGTGNDELHGGAGNDNLYAGDTLAVTSAANTKKHKYDAGRDLALGEHGSDWFEPTKNWWKTDVDKRDGEEGRAQNAISGDPDAGRYDDSNNATGVVVRNSFNGDASLDGQVDLTDIAII